MNLCTFQKSYRRWFEQHPEELCCVIGFFLMLWVLDTRFNDPLMDTTGVFARTAPLVAGVCALGSLILLLKLLFFVFQPRQISLRWQDDALWFGERRIQFGVVSSSGVAVKGSESLAERNLTLQMNASAEPYSYQLKWHNQAGVQKTSAKGYIAGLTAAELSTLLADKVSCTLSQQAPFFRSSGSGSTS